MVLASNQGKSEISLCKEVFPRHSGGAGNFYAYSQAYVPKTEVSTCFLGTNADESIHQKVALH